MIVKKSSGDAISQFCFTPWLLPRLCPIVLLFVLASASAQCSDWVVESVDLSGDVGWSLDIECLNPDEVQLLYDSQSSTNDYRAIRDASSWTYYYSFADFTSFDLALGSDGTARLLATELNGSAHDLKYYQEASLGGWYSLNVASGVNSGNAKLGIDVQDNAYLAFVDQATKTLKCAKLETVSDGVWNMDVDPIITDSVFNTSNERIRMAMDNAGKPNILWYDYGTSRLKRAYKPIAGGAWQVDTIYTGNVSMGFSAAFDSDNKLHLAYSDYGTGGNAFQIRHAVYDEGLWSDEQVSAFGDQVGSLAIDSYDQLHIGYIDFDTAAGKDVFRYATYLGDYWHDEAVAELSSSVQGNEELDMVMDSQRHLHMAFRGDANELRYARLDEPPRPKTTEDRSVTVSLDAQAELLSWGSFMITEGETSISVDKYDYLDIDDRGVLEFFVGDLAVNEEIVSARLELQICVLGHSSDTWPTPQVYAYEGDGDIDPSDAEKTAILAGTSEEIQDLGAHSINLDAEVLSAQLDEHPWLGLLLVAVEQDFNFYSLESYSGTPATLILEIDAHLFGDATCDGTVDADDAAMLAEHWLMSSGATWGNGDFNGDGKVDDQDATILAANWGASKYNNAVPEPQFLALLLAGAAMLFARRIA